MDGLVEAGEVCEGLVGEVMGLEIEPAGSISLSSGAYFGSHSTVSQCARAARAASERVPGPPPAELFFRKALDSCERLMRTPSPTGRRRSTRARLCAC